MVVKRLNLSPAAWREIKGIVTQGALAERGLGKPIEVINGETKIVITDEQISIWWND